MQTALSLPKKRLPTPNNVFTVPFGSELDFFKWWCVFLRPFVKLTDREVEIIAHFLKERRRLSQVISDPAVLDTQLMGASTLEKIIKECNITKAHFYVLMSHLREHNIISKTGINPRLIPNIRVDDKGTFQLLVLFKEKEEA